MFILEFVNRYKEARSRIPEGIIWEIARQTYMGLIYLKSKNVIHRDIKTYNIFVTSNNVVKVPCSYKIGDLGVSIVVRDDTKPNPKGIVSGTPIYYAPELFRHIPYDYKVV